MKNTKKYLKAYGIKLKKKSNEYSRKYNVIKFIL